VKGIYSGTHPNSFRKPVMIRLSSILTAIAFTSISVVPAHAGIFDRTPTDGAGFYVSGFVGVAVPFDTDFDGTQNPAASVPGVAGTAASIDADLDSDVYFGGAVGGRLPFKFFKTFQPRWELEVSHFESDISSGEFNSGDQTFSGNQSQSFILINSFNEIRWTENQTIVPYFGGGFGLGIIDTDIQYFPNNGAFTAPNFAVQGQDTAFATASTIGVTLNATEKFDVFTEAKYLKTYGVDAERRFIDNGADGFSADVDDDPDGLTFTVGTRVKF